MYIKVEVRYLKIHKKVPRKNTDKKSPANKKSSLGKSPVKKSNIYFYNYVIRWCYYFLN